MTIPKECKRLAEVDFPLASVGKCSLAEKALRMGTPHQLHLWWAWRPLAACRAMLMGLLLPDPCDSLCPQTFKDTARKYLYQVPGSVGTTDQDLQRALLRFIADFSNWDLASDKTFLEVSRQLVKSAYPVELPLIVDPFSGSGSIPLEALRLGCDTFSSDLNPVASLIEKVILEDIPRHGPSLAEDLLRVGKEIKSATERELEKFYPKDSDGSQPIAYLWARTVQCESPNCGAEIPLIRSFWLSKKAKRKRALRYNIARQKGKLPQVQFDIFEPQKDQDVPKGTVTRAKAKCVCCNNVLSPERVCQQLAAQSGGADACFDEHGVRTSGSRMLAVVTVKSSRDGRRYRLPTNKDYIAVWEAQKKLSLNSKHNPPFSLVPDEPLPPIGTLGFRVQRYGMKQWGDLFTSRQKLTLATFAKKIADLNNEKCQEVAALCLSKLAERNNSICDWMVDVECPGHLYTQQVVP